MAKTAMGRVYVSDRAGQLLSEHESRERLLRGVRELRHLHAESRTTKVATKDGKEITLRTGTLRFSRDARTGRLVSKRK